MTTALRFRAAASRLARRFSGGAATTLRRANALVEGAGDDEVTALAVDGNHVAGATSIDLRAAAVDGHLVAGITVAIDGHAAPYTVTALVAASADTLASVPLTPALTDAANDGTAVTVAATVDYSVIGAEEPMRRQIEDAAEAAVVHWIAAEGVDYGPTTDDTLVVDGEALPVRAVEPARIGGTVAGWRVTCGRADA